MLAAVPPTEPAFATQWAAGAQSQQIIVEGVGVHIALRWIGGRLSIQGLLLRLQSQIQFLRHHCRVNAAILVVAHPMALLRAMQWALGALSRRAIVRDAEALSARLHPCLPREVLGSPCEV